jgi:hypothetical protein
MSTVFYDTLAASTDCDHSDDETAALIRDEYRDLPGLVLTAPQVCRMFQIDPSSCEVVMNRFVTEGLLVRLPNGSFANRRSRM